MINGHGVYYVLWGSRPSKNHHFTTNKQRGMLFFFRIVNMFLPCFLPLGIFIHAFQVFSTQVTKDSLGGQAAMNVRKLRMDTSAKKGCNMTQQTAKRADFWLV